MEIWNSFHQDVVYFKEDGQYLVKQRLHNLDFYDLEGSFEQAAAKIQSTKADFPVGELIDADYFDYIDDKKSPEEGFSIFKKREGKRAFIFDKVYLEKGDKHDGAGGSYCQLFVVGIRKSTQSEMNCLIEEEKKDEAKRQEYRRQEYERLKREFEKS